MSLVASYLRLMRISNVPTAWADVIAGALIAGAGADRAGMIALLCLASSCFYSGGMALNDVCDTARDAAKRPERPIPSGSLKRSHALLFAVMLLAAGCLLSVGGGFVSLLVGMGLVAAIVAYDWMLKQMPIAPAVMGVCRALNLLLGASVIGLRSGSAIWIAAGLLWLYIVSLTSFARRESGGATPGMLVGGFAGMLASIVGQAMLVATAFPAAGERIDIVPCALTMLLLCVAACRYCIPAIRSAQPADIQRAVGGLILLIVLFDASMVCAVRGVMPMLIVCGLALPAIALSRRSLRT